MNISTKLFENRLNTFRKVDFLSFHYSYIRQNSPAPWRPCFSTNQHLLKESNKGSPKEHFYKIIWKSAWHFWRRRFFKFSLFFSFGCHGIQNYGWIKKKLRNFREDMDASCEVSTKLAKWLGRWSCLKEKVNARTHAQRTIRHDISSTGFQPVELKITQNKQFLLWSSSFQLYSIIILSFKGSLCLLVNSSAADLLYVGKG